MLGLAGFRVSCRAASHLGRDCLVLEMFCLADDADALEAHFQGLDRADLACGIAALSGEALDSEVGALGTVIDFDSSGRFLEPGDVLWKPVGRPADNPEQALLPADGSGEKFHGFLFITARSI